MFTYPGGVLCCDANNRNCSDNNSTAEPHGYFCKHFFSVFYEATIKNKMLSLSFTHYIITFTHYPAPTSKSDLLNWHVFVTSIQLYKLCSSDCVWLCHGLWIVSASSVSHYNAIYIYRALFKLPIHLNPCQLKILFFSVNDIVSLKTSGQVYLGPVRIAEFC